ncbi:MAG: thiamine pyrophosphate-dependent enzyme [Actinomycetota bacterium]
MKRLDALGVADEVFAGRPMVVTLGATARELASLAKRDSHLYLLDSMGLAPSVGIGLACAGRAPVAVIEGDGSLLMGLTTLASLAYLRPPGVTLLVLDNHEHASAAGVATQAATVSLAQACRGFGLPTTEVIDAESLRSALARGRDSMEVTVVVASIEPGNAPGVPLLLDDPVVIAERFRSFLREGS